MVDGLIGVLLCLIILSSAEILAPRSVVLTRNSVDLQNQICSVGFCGCLKSRREVPGQDLIRDIERGKSRDRVTFWTLHSRFDDIALFVARLTPKKGFALCTFRIARAARRNIALQVFLKRPGRKQPAEITA